MMERNDTPFRCACKCWEGEFTGRTIVRMPTYEYPRPGFSADSVVIAGPSGDRYVLLVRRGIEPFLGMWAVPGGFVNEMEPVETAARRELSEETGLSVPGARFQMIGTFGDPGRDPRGWTVAAAFVIDLGDEMPPVQGGDDAADAAWHPLSSLPDLAFDHARIVEAAIERLGASRI